MNNKPLNLPCDSTPRDYLEIDDCGQTGLSISISSLTDTGGYAEVIFRSRDKLERIAKAIKTYLDREDLA